MFNPLEFSRGQGETSPSTPDIKTELEKLREEASQIKAVIKDLEAKKTEYMSPGEAAAHLSIIKKERARLTPLILQLQKAGLELDEKYVLQKPQPTEQKHLADEDTAFKDTLLEDNNVHYLDRYSEADIIDKE